MTAEVLYKFPHAQQIVKLTQYTSEPETFSSFEELNGKEGFVIAPFAIDDAHPIVLIHPEKEVVMGTKDETNDVCYTNNVADKSIRSPQLYRKSYQKNFKCFHAQLIAHQFDKIVLARSQDMEIGSNLSNEKIFRKACMQYPEMSVILVSTKVTGTWLMATPEVLLTGEGTTWHTMALAGTMKISVDKSNSWSDKNKHEQQIVTKYIHQCLMPFTENINETTPHTVHAGNLIHLRSDFTFTLRDSYTLGTLLGYLHPTPAVCGLPKQKAQQFIIEHEHTKRAYYSGFVGLLHPLGKTYLYVSLRCMQILPNCYRLYAGGGLLEDSVEQQEWEETVAKMETMEKTFSSPLTLPNREESN